VIRSIMHRQRPIFNALAMLTHLPENGSCLVLPGLDEGCRVVYYSCYGGGELQAEDGIILKHRLPLA
jgi:hypothetical protein